MRAALLVLMALAGCAAEPDWSAAAHQALADGRASLAALGAPAPADAPAPREPTRIRPLRTARLPVPPLAGGSAGFPTHHTDAAAAYSPVRPPAGGPAAEQPAVPRSLPASATALTGSGPERLVAMLGEPALRRAEGAVSIWLYSAAGCQLDVMFYPGAEGPRVAHVQARAGGFAQRTEAACLRDLAASARRRPPEPQQGRLALPEPVG